MVATLHLPLFARPMLLTVSVGSIDPYLTLSCDREPAISNW